MVGRDGANIWVNVSLLYYTIIWVIFGFEDHISKKNTVSSNLHSVILFFNPLFRWCHTDTDSLDKDRKHSRNPVAESAQRYKLGLPITSYVRQTPTSLGSFTDAHAIGAKRWTSATCDSFHWTPLWNSERFSFFMRMRVHPSTIYPISAKLSLASKN